MNKLIIKITIWLAELGFKYSLMRVKNAKSKEKTNIWAYNGLMFINKKAELYIILNRI